MVRGQAPGFPELRLHDAQLVVYGDVRAQIIENAERWHDLDVPVSLTPRSDGPADLIDTLFVATIHTSYRTVPSTPTMRFACISDTPGVSRARGRPGR